MTWGEFGIWCLGAGCGLVPSMLGLMLARRAASRDLARRSKYAAIHRHADELDELDAQLRARLDEWHAAGPSGRER